MILYPAHPYMSDPLKSFMFAKRVTNKLIRMGYQVYSPIVSSHPVETFNPIKGFDWVDYDLKMMKGMLNDDAEWDLYQCPNCGDKYYCSDLSNLICEYCGGKEHHGQGTIHYQLDHIPKYDTGLIILMSKDAYIFEKEVSAVVWKGLLKTHTLDESGRLWLSNGCLAEKKWAEDNHVRVLKLEEFLEGKEVEL